jgi:hypothetical protein
MGNGKSILRSLCIYQLPITHYPLPITYKSSNVVPPLEIVALVPQCYSLALLV